MDLRSVLNDSGSAADRDRDRERERDRSASAPKHPPTPQQQPHQLPQHHQQSPSSYQYRGDYAHHPSQPQPHPSPGKPPHQDYPHGPHQSPQGSYPPQSPYQQPAPYAGRPGPPPPLQPSNSFHDPRSPTGAMPAPSPTAYRQTPTQTPGAGPAGGAAGYPFPQQEMTSPSMRHHQPPASYRAQQQPQRQESYSQSPAQYAQQPPGHVPQPSPVVTTGGAHPYPPHQRSQSTHSTPTPTSAHSQHAYGQPYPHGSPVASAHPPPNEYNRPPSQPPTPHAAPVPGVQRQSTGPVAYAQPAQQQPSSPYQQRLHMPSAQPAQVQASPPQPPPPQPPQHSSIQRMPTGPGAHEISSPVNHQRTLSHHDREHSLSVSPKTRVPSLPSSADRKSISVDHDRKPAPAPEPMAIDTERAVTPAKRKLDDRNLSPHELERKETRPPPAEVNGDHVLSRRDSTRVKTESPKMSKKKKRQPRKEPPIWAQSASILGKQLPKNDNYVLQKRIHSHINGGKPDGPPSSRHQTPEKTKPRPSQAVVAVPESGPQDLLGSWEPSLTGVRPYEEVSRMIADFLFVHVVNNEDMREITSRGIKFEVEAKLGTLIDKDTNHRVERGIESEGVLTDTGRTAFKSSMTEGHHKAFNDFLNQTVYQTDPRSGAGRVPVQYKHRRELDRFVELPPELQQRVPSCMRSRISSGRRSIRVRLTYDQKTQEVIGKIIKARVADIDLHIPSCPMDCRLSINLEMDWDGSAQELEQLAASQADRQPDRNKDRLSYTHGHYQIDLTQVTQSFHGPGANNRTEKEHELEIELAPGILIDQGRRALDGAPHRYQELVEGLVDNIRVLSRKAREIQQGA